jgi:hypothetical protein
MFELAVEGIPSNRLKHGPPASPGVNFDFEPAR